MPAKLEALDQGQDAGGDVFGAAQVSSDIKRSQPAKDIDENLVSVVKD